MCVPVAALAAVSLVASLAGSAVSYMGQQSQARAASQASMFQANMALEQAANTSVQASQQRMILTENEGMALQAAADARRRGEAAIEQARIKQGQLAGRQKSVMAKNGVELGYGSPLDVLGDTAMLGELDANTLKSNFEREAQASEAQARNLEAQGEALKTKGAMAMSAGSLQSGYYSSAAASQLSAGATAGAGTLLSGVGSVAEKWYKMS